MFYIFSHVGNKFPHTVSIKFQTLSPLEKDTKISSLSKLDAVFSRHSNDNDMCHSLKVCDGLAVNVNG